MTYLAFWSILWNPVWPLKVKTLLTSSACDTWPSRSLNKGMDQKCPYFNFFLALLLHWRWLSRWWVKWLLTCEAFQDGVHGKCSICMQNVLWSNCNQAVWFAFLVWILICYASQLPDFSITIPFPVVSWTWSQLLYQGASLLISLHSFF